MISTQLIFNVVGASFLALCLLCSVSVADEIHSLPSLDAYTCIFPEESDSGVTVTSTEILKTLLSSQGDASLQFLHTTNTASALELIAEHPEYIIAGIPKLPKMGEFFAWVGPIYTLNPIVIAEREKNIDLTTPSDLSKYRVGVLEHDTTAHIALELLTVGRIITVQTYSDLFALLSEKHIDIIVTEHLHATEYLKKNHKLENYEITSFLSPVPYYYAFPKNTDPTLITSYQNMFNDLEIRSHANITAYAEEQGIISSTSYLSTFSRSYYVLILSSYSETNPETKKHLNGIDTIFGPDPRIRYTFDSLYLERMPTGSDISAADMNAYLNLTSEAAFMRHRDTIPDAIITIGTQAYYAAQHYTSSHGLEIPIIYDMVAPAYRENGEKTGVLRTYAVSEAIDLAKKIHPNRDEIYVICSQKAESQLILEKIREIAPKDKEYTFFYAPYDLTLEELIEDIEAHTDAIILLIDYNFHDTSQSFYLTGEDVSKLTEKISAPVYTLTDAYNSEHTGIVGGYQTSMERVGELLGVQTSRILFGEQTSEIPTYVYHSSQPIIYERAFEQYFGEKSELPHNAIVISSSIPNIQLSISLSFLIASVLLSLLAIAGILFFMQRKLAIAHSALKENQEFLEEIIDSMPIAVAVIDPHTDQCLLMNEAMNQIIDLGFTYYIDNIYKNFKKIKNNIMLSGEAYEEEKECTTELGKQMFQFHVNPIRNIEGSIQFIMIQCIDVTAARKKEQEARIALDRLHRFIEQNVAAILFLKPVYNEDGEIRTAQYYIANKAFYELTHLIPENVLEKELQEDFLNEYIKEAYSLLTNEASAVPFNLFQSEFYDFIASGFVFMAGTDSSYLCIHLTDETEYHHHYLAEQLGAQKLEAVLMELAVLNDQIRNPLTVILCSLEADTIHARSDFEVEINKVDAAIDQLDRRFLVTESLHSHIREKEKVRGSSVMTKEETDYFNEHVLSSLEEEYS